MALSSSNDTAYEAQVITELKLAKENDGHRIHHPTTTPGLYVTAKAKRLPGKVVVESFCPVEKRYHVVWDSAELPVKRESTEIIIPHYEPVTRVPGVTVRNHEVENDLKIWYKPLEGPSSFVEIRPSKGKESAGPAARSNPRRKHTLQPEEGAWEEADKKGAEPTRKSARRSVRETRKGMGRRAAVEDAKEEIEDLGEIFLYIREAFGKNGRLIINTANNAVHLVTGKDNVIQTSTELDFSDNSRVQIYPFLKGVTLRFINCGLVTKAKKGVDGKRRERKSDKWVSALLLPKSKAAEHEKYSMLEAKEYPVYEKREHEAVHNEKALSEFLRWLGDIVGMGRVEECKREKVPNVEILMGSG